MMAQQDPEEMIFALWSARVFSIQGDRLSGSGVLINNKRVLTAAHLGFTIGNKYIINGTETRGSVVECVYISKRTDFALLRSDDLSEMHCLMDFLDRGHTCYIMGYPGKATDPAPSIAKGTVERHLNDGKTAVNPGFRKGYNGGPVFGQMGFIFGILLGGIDTPAVGFGTGGDKDVIGEQLSARVLPHSIVEFCSQNTKTDESS